MFKDMTPEQRKQAVAILEHVKSALYPVGFVCICLAIIRRKQGESDIIDLIEQEIKHRLGSDTYLEYLVRMGKITTDDVNSMGYKERCRHRGKWIDSMIYELDNVNVQ